MSVTDLRPPFTIGGSDAAAACGLDPFRSRIMLCAARIDTTRLKAEAPHVAATFTETTTTRRFTLA